MCVCVCVCVCVVCVCLGSCVCVYHSEVSGGFGGESLDAAGVAVFAENMAIQWVAALVVSLRE